MEYLTESKLDSILKIIYPNSNIIHNKAFPNYKFRPDYRIENEKIIIEFDGYLHYTQSKVIINDYYKNQILFQNNYKIIRIPYFIQLSQEIILKLFQKNINFIQEYPHGFIDKKACLPSDFCYLGIKRFEEDLNYFNICYNDIIKSLKNKIIENKNINLVLPEILHFLII